MLPKKLSGLDAFLARSEHHFFFLLHIALQSRNNRDFCIDIFVVFWVQSMSPVKADELTLKRNILNTFVASS